MLKKVFWSLLLRDNCDSYAVGSFTSSYGFPHTILGKLFIFLLQDYLFPYPEDFYYNGGDAQDDENDDDEIMVRQRYWFFFKKSH